MDNQIQTWLESGIIKATQENSPWNSALLVVPKKDISGRIKGWRVCIDPRHINLLIPDANFPLPLIREVLKDLSGAKIFSKINRLETRLQSTPSQGTRSDQNYLYLEEHTIQIYWCPLWIFECPFHISNDDLRSLCGFEFRSCLR